MLVRKLKRGPSAPLASSRDPFLALGAEEEDGMVCRGGVAGLQGRGPASTAPALQFTSPLPPSHPEKCFVYSLPARWILRGNNSNDCGCQVPVKANRARCRRSPWDGSWTHLTGNRVGHFNRGRQTPFAQKLGLLRDRGGSMRRPCAPDPDPRRGARVDCRAPALATCRLFRGRAPGGVHFLTLSVS